MRPRLLVAGVGNIFLGDDGFGVAVARQLASQALPGWVKVVDFGIRGVHLAYELLDGGYDAAILIDAAPRGGEPGAVYLIQPDLSSLDAAACGEPDAHGMNPQAVFGMLKLLGGTPGRVWIVGCEPAQTAEEMGLSEPVRRAVDEACRLVLRLVRQEEAAGLPAAERRE
jgi:hydrogenase maturation protease